MDKIKSALVGLACQVLDNPKTTLGGLATIAGTFVPGITLGARITGIIGGLTFIFASRDSKTPPSCSQ